jgi:pimeloyl-ACP methyl ester carboxylesterase
MLLFVDNKAGSVIMKQWTAAVMVVLAWVTSALATHENKLVDIRAEYFWRFIHATAANHKAIATANNGAVGYAYGMGAEAEANRLALEYCNERSKFIALKKPPILPCEIMSTGDSWKLASAKVDPDWQKPTSGKDATMRKGRKHVIKGSKAIILLVHGCNGLGDRIFTDVWGAYFNALGYDLYAPDSFAVKRPKEVCGMVDDFPPEQISTVWRLRIAQTQRNLADLRAANPGKPIYLFGHSEGGLIVQMVETDVAGIIVSGEECGVFGAPVAAARTVPLLYVWGEFDQYLNGMGFRISEDSGRKCETLMPTHKPRFAVLPGRSHIPWPWNVKVNEAIASFLGEKPVNLPKQQAANKKAFANWKRTKKDKRYRTAAPHRASAINKNGTSYMVWGLDNEEDAKELALFGCTRATSKKSNVFKTAQHLCTVIDVNGKAPK